MKLFIQIPCFNEEQTLPETLASLPGEVDGFESVTVVVIDDGSTDRTAQVATDAGVPHVVSFKHNKGLAAAFSAGLETCVRLGADVIVNTDADNQYDANSISDLVEPIRQGTADMVVGARDIDAVPHFSPLKKRLQKLGSKVVCTMSGTDVADATSGFRAMTCEVASTLVVHSDYTYTLETLIQAGRHNFAVVSVPIGTNPKTRESRLMSSTSQYIWRSIVTLLRIYTLYRPLRVFASLGALCSGLGILIGLRFMIFRLIDGGQGHVQSLILVAILMTIGILLFVLGIVADLLAANRRLIEDLRIRMGKIERKGPVPRD
jgi:glycosyltransferase involved in cell wall biosynthesis